MVKVKWSVSFERAGGHSDEGLSCIRRNEHGVPSRVHGQISSPGVTGACWVTVCAGKVAKRMWASHVVMAHGLCSQVTRV